MHGGAKTSKKYTRPKVSRYHIYFKTPLGYIFHKLLNDYNIEGGCDFKNHTPPTPNFEILFYLIFANFY